MWCVRIGSSRSMSVEMERCTDCAHEQRRMVSQRRGDCNHPVTEQCVAFEDGGLVETVSEQLSLSFSCRTHTVQRHSPDVERFDGLTSVVVEWYHREYGWRSVGTVESAHRIESRM
jgi:hypothetical protein